MKQEILEKVPEFELIADAELRARCLKVWVKALNRGGWTAADLERIPFTLQIPQVGISYAEHIRAVTRCSAAIADAYQEIYGDRVEIDRDVLLAGALLHDVGKLVEYAEQDSEFRRSAEGEYVRHTFSGVGLAYDEGLPPEVLHIIAVHSKEGELGPRSPEALIVHHADFANFEPLRATLK
jgi:putative nucleotidyltransferase with HDIG domain